MIIYNNLKVQRKCNKDNTIRTIIAIKIPTKITNI